MFRNVLGPPGTSASRVLLWGVLLAGLFGFAGIQPGWAQARPATKTFLFVDDYYVLYRSGTHRVFHPFTRYPGNPVIKGNQLPWETAIAWCSLYRNPSTGLYQIWYQGAGNQPRDKTRRSVVCYAESTDGINFRKPDLGLFDFDGNNHNSIVLVANGGTSDRYGASVVVGGPGSDPSRRYKMAFYDFVKDETGTERPGLCVAFSPDGIHWTKYSHAPLIRSFYGDFEEPVPSEGERGREWAIPLTMSDAMDAIYDPRRSEYVIYGKMWIDGPAGGMGWKHGMGRTSSKDFIHWSKSQLLLSPDDEDPEYVEFHTAPVFYYDDCYFSPVQILDRGKGGGVIDIELALSRDGFNWQRPFRNHRALPFGPAGKFDGGSIFTNASPVVLPSEIRFYYGAYSGGATGGDDTSWTSGIGFASIPKDRFAGIRPDSRSAQPTLARPLENIGQITLKTLELSPGTELTLNADASTGTVRVEVLDDNGYRIRGFTDQDSIPIHGDALAHKIHWQAHSINELPAGRYMLRLHLDNAEVFALTAAGPGKN